MMSKIRFGQQTSVNVRIVGISLHPTYDKTLTLRFANYDESYQCLVNLTQLNLHSIDYALKTLPSPCPQYLCFDIIPSFVNDEIEADRLGLQATDRELLAKLFERIPNLLEEHWLTQKDICQFIDFQSHFVSANTNTEDN